MKQKHRTKIEKPAITGFITETDLKREMENAIEQKDATIVTLSLELSELKNKYNHQSKRLGGFVQSNKNYREKNKLQVLEICDLGITINSIKERCKSQQIDIKGLKVDVAAAETNYELEYRKAKELSSQLQSVRSKWWFWLFNW